MNSPMHISLPGLKRLPKYHALVKNLVLDGHKNVSSTTIAKHLNLEPIIIRKDLEGIQLIGKPKIGYNANDLLNIIATFMGWNRMDELILVGCGDLGSALLRYNGFKERGFKIIAGFDINQTIIGTEINDCPIFSLEKLPDLCKRLHLKIGILTVPAEHAQETAELMIESGILGIWNFSPTALDVPEYIRVQREDLLTSLTILRKEFI